ncbi:MAG: caspase family protein [Alphaproteobacteria bacterium]|nr:caspase family protein [Alphaproteobacteria bacterium]
MMWLTLPAAAETRLALVIGNADYKTAPLVNPVNDAHLIATALKSVGFQVTTVTNANQQQMKNSILRFGRALAKDDSVGLFYYAGHGVQVAGENFLIPLGADIKDDDEVALSSVNLTHLLRKMAHSKSRLNIAILDACRDNPFAAGVRSPSRGLAPVEAPSGTLIGYATAPGKVALDGEGSNSPYSAALARAIPTVGVPIEEVFRQTRRKVLSVTGGKQTPWEHSSLTGAFYFHAKSIEPEATARQHTEELGNKSVRLAELADWEKIKSSDRAGDYRKHIKRYPDGLFKELASLRIERFKNKFSPWTWIITGSTGKTTTRSAPKLFERALELESEAGDGERERLVEAFSLYRESAELGFPAAMYRLARSYDKGRGTSRDVTAAAQWYGRAAENGHAPAMAALATMYELGDGAKQNLAEALRFYRLAADAGEVRAMTNLGFLYAEGKGVAKDPKRAKTWYGKAANAGNTRAMFNLGLLLLAEKRNRKAWKVAVGWLKKAADRGHTGALRELAVLYDEGRGVARSPRIAAKYLLDAFGAGSERAAFDIRVRPDTWSYWTRRQIQKRLRRLGYYKGRSHGFFDSRTRIALEAFVKNS